MNLKFTLYQIPKEEIIQTEKIQHDKIWISNLFLFTLFLYMPCIDKKKNHFSTYFQLSKYNVW